MRIPTVNPPGDCYAECAAAASPRRFTSSAIAVETLAADGPARTHRRVPRVSTSSGALGSSHDASPALHFNGHYDVVPPGAGWTVDPFGAELRDGRIYGRGTCDQKAGIAASIYAVEAVRRAGVRLPARSSRARPPTRRAAASLASPGCATTATCSSTRQRYVVITEPLDPERVCIGHRGVYWFELTTLGRVGHGSMPGSGGQRRRADGAPGARLRNRAEAARSRCDSHARRSSRRRRASPSINLNAIHAGQSLGGWQTPTVPDRCTAMFDRRFIHEERFDDVRAEIVDVLDSQGIAYELRDVMRVDPLLGDPGGVLAQTTARRHSRCAAASSPASSASPGTYDQKHVVRRAGIDECIAYGPGRLVLAHQPDEYVAVADLVAAAKVMALLTLRLAALLTGLLRLRSHGSVSWRRRLRNGCRL